MHASSVASVGLYSGFVICSNLFRELFVVCVLAPVSKQVIAILDDHRLRTKSELGVI